MFYRQSPGPVNGDACSAPDKPGNFARIGTVDGRILSVYRAMRSKTTPCTGTCAE